MRPKLFTLNEANALLPSLEPLMRRIMTSRQTLHRHRHIMEEFRARASRTGGALPGVDFAQAKTETARLLAEIQDGAKEIESYGCVIKDLDRGLVDFLSQRGPEQVFLCWRLGETEIRYWHRLQDGFAGRKPLQEDPAE